MVILQKIICSFILPEPKTIKKSLHFWLPELFLKAVFVTKNTKYTTHFKKQLLGNHVLNVFQHDLINSMFVLSFRNMHGRSWSAICQFVATWANLKRIVNRIDESARPCVKRRSKSPVTIFLFSVVNNSIGNKSFNVH